MREQTARNYVGNVALRTVTDPISFSIVPLLLLLVTFAASAAPSLAATRLDPIRALHYE